MTWSFVVTALVICAAPGVGALYTVSSALTRGLRAGLLAAVACTLGIVPHLLAAITGLAALLHTSALAFEVLRIAGVCYLFWMAWGTWRETGSLTLPTRDDVRPVTVSSVLVRGVTLNLLNPKLTVFFFAFLPQFVSSGGSNLAQMVQLSLVFMAMTLAVFAVYAACAAALQQRLLTRPRLGDRIRKTFAVGFAAVGVQLAVSSSP